LLRRQAPRNDSSSEQIFDNCYNKIHTPKKKTKLLRQSADNSQETSRAYAHLFCQALNFVLEQVPGKTTALGEIATGNSFLGLF
jgi:hypothetical protein